MGCSLLSHPLFPGSRFQPPTPPPPAAPRNCAEPEDPSETPFPAPSAGNLSHINPGASPGIPQGARGEIGVPEIQGKSPQSENGSGAQLLS